MPLAWSMPNPELVVFDMAGTTVRDDGGAVNRCLRDALQSAGVSATFEQVNEVMGWPKPDAIASLLVSGSAAKVTEIHDDFVARMLDFYNNDPSVGEIDGASELFQRLRARGTIVALDTGFSRIIADTILARLGWQTKIDGSITSDEVSRGRPFPDMVLALMKRFDVEDPARVAKIGDTPSDLREGTSAGCGWVVGFTGGSHTDEQLAAHPHTHRIATLAELPALFARR